jgi:hypothetical protein
MAGIDDVLERLINDDRFREQLATDPDTALAAYDLTADDRALLISQVTTDAGRSGTLEARASKAGLFGLLGGLDEIADAVVGSEGLSADAPSQPPQSDLDFVQERARDGGMSYQNTFQAIPDGPATPTPGGESLAAAPTEPERAGWPVKWELSELDASSADAAAPVDGEVDTVETADAPPDADEAATWTAIALAESGGNTGVDAQSADGGTMATDDWEDQQSAGSPEPAERAIDGGPGSDAPDAAGGEDSTGLWQINADAATRPGPDAAEEGPSMRPWTVTHGDNHGPAAADEKITIHGQYDVASGADRASGEAETPAKPGSAHVAISLGDGQTVEAGSPASDSSLAVTPDAPPPSADDPDRFDVSELTQWSTAHGSAAPEGLDAAGADDEAAQSPTPDD